MSEKYSLLKKRKNPEERKLLIFKNSDHKKYKLKTTGNRK